MSDPVTILSIYNWINIKMTNIMDAILNYPLVNVLTFVLAVIIVSGFYYLLGLISK